MDAKEIVKITSKVWCDTNDLMKLSGLGITYTSKLKKQIKEELLRKGKILPRGLVPMREVIKKLDIDIEYYRKQAEYELKKELVKNVL